MANTFFAFLDKHFPWVIGAVCALLIWRLGPDPKEKKEQDDANARLDVNKRLIEPTPPVLDKSGHMDKSAETKYWAQEKAHRSAVFAQNLRNELSKMFFPNVKLIMATAYDMAITGVSFDSVAADYLALQTTISILSSKKPSLADDLRGALSSAEYVDFMHRVGLTKQAAYQATHPKK